MKAKLFYLPLLALLGMGLLLLGAWDMQGAAAAAAPTPEGWTPSTPLPDELVGNLVHCADMPGTFYMVGGVLDGNVISDQLLAFDDDDWVPKASMPEPRQDPATVCYRGRIYVAGGGNPDGSSPNVSDSLFIYDIAGNYWFIGPDLPSIVWGAAMGAWDGKLYLVGGSRGGVPYAPVKRVDTFDIARGEWTVNGGTPVPTEVSFFSSAQVGQYLYVVGGYSGDMDHNVNQTQRYDMNTDTWEIGPIFTSARAFGELKATSIRLYMVGGDLDGGTFHDSTDLIEVLDLAGWPGGAWVPFEEQLPVPNMHPGLTCTPVYMLKSYLWIVGGADTDLIPYDEVYYRNSEVCGSFYAGDLIEEEISLGNYPGTKAHFILPVVNAGSLQDTYDVEVSDDSGFLFSTTIGPLAPGETGLLELALPDDPAIQLEALVRYTVTLTSRGNPQMHDTAILNLTTSLWQEAAAMPVGVGYHSVARCADDPDGFYIIGGGRVNQEPVDDIWYYNGGKDTWTFVTDMPLAQWGNTTTCYDGKLYMVDGFAYWLRSYDLASGVWNNVSLAPQTINASSMGAWDGKLFIAGGAPDGSSTLHIYDLASGAWSAGPDLPVPVIGAGYVQAGPYLYMVGGMVPDMFYHNQNTTLRLNMADQTWSIGPEFASRRFYPALGMTVNHLYAIGGDQNGYDVMEPNGLVEVLDLSQWPGGEWQSLEQPLPWGLVGNWGGTCTETELGAQIWSVGGAYGLMVNYGVLNQAYYLPVGEACVRYGVDVLADEQGTGEIGETVKYVLMVANTGLATDYFKLAVESKWPANGNGLLIGPLEPGESTQVEVLVTVPEDVQPGEQGLTEVTARSLGNPQAQDVAQIITVATGWYSGADLPQGLALSAHVQCADDPNHVYLLGGKNRSGSPVNSFYRYNIWSNQWERLNDLPVAAYGLSAACLNGKIYVIDGTTNMKIYFIAMNMWVSEAGVPRRTEGAALGAHNGKLYLVGGVARPTYQASNQVDVYDIARRMWLPSVDAKMPAATAYAGVAQYGNVLFIVGGMSSIYQPVFLVQRYDMGSHTWQTADYPTGMVFPGLVVTSEYLYVLGGDPAGDQAWTASDLVERLALSDWQAGAWEPVGYHLRKPVLGVSGYCTEVLFGGEVWEVGGSDGDAGWVVYTNIYYRPAEECWIDPAR